MTAPSAPYCTSADVAAMNLFGLRNKTDFDNLTVIKKAEVETLIGLTSAHISIIFQSAGYVVPFQETSDISWPTHQTEYLKLLCALGAAAKVFIDALIPTAFLAQGGAKMGNLFKVQYDEEIAKVYDHKTRETTLQFHAAYRNNTPAFRLMRTPYGPRTDYGTSEINLHNYASFEQVTYSIAAMQEAIQRTQLLWYDEFGEVYNEGIS